MDNNKKIGLIEYFLNDNQSGYKTREKHIKKKFFNLIGEINDYNKNHFNLELPFTQKLYNFLYDITELPKCENCGKEIKWRGIFSEGYLKNCSKKCRGESTIRVSRMKKTNVERYSVEFVTQTNFIIEKRKHNYFQKHGVESPFQNPNIIEKINKTNIERHNTKHPIQNEQIKATRIKNNIIKYDVEYPSQLQSQKEINIKNGKIYFENKLEKKGYLVISYLKDKKVIIKHPDGHLFETPRSIANNRYNNGAELSTILLPIGGNKSTGEIEIKQFLCTLNIKYTEGNRKILSGLELDIYIDDHILAIEYNGLYWHSCLHKTNDYHLIKTKECEKLGINLLHIFEDEWCDKKEIVKSIIKSKLNIFDEIINVNNCIIKEIDTKLRDEFLNNNHIEGNINDKIRIGLFYKEELISLMTFDEKNFANNEYELLRICNKINIQIIGGINKLLEYFIIKYMPISISTFVNRRYSQGEEYNKLDFELIKYVKPKYWYFEKGKLIRFDKSFFKENNLQKNKYIKIYDCGGILFKKYYK